MDTSSSKVSTEGLKSVYPVKSSSEQEQNTTDIISMASIEENGKEIATEKLEKEVKIIYAHNPTSYTTKSESSQSFIEVLPSTSSDQSSISSKIESEKSQNPLDILPAAPSGQSLIFSKTSSESSHRFVDIFSSTTSEECVKITKNISSLPTVSNRNKEQNMRISRRFSDSWKKKSNRVSAKIQSYNRMCLKSQHSMRSTGSQSDQSSSAWCEQVEADVESLFSSTGVVCQQTYDNSSDIENKFNKKLFEIKDKRSQLKWKIYSADELYNIKQKSSDFSLFSKSLPMKLPDYSKALKSSDAYFSGKLSDNILSKLHEPTSHSCLERSLYVGLYSKSSKKSATSEDTIEREVIEHVEGSSSSESKFLGEINFEESTTETKSKKCFQCCAIM